jgi:hypothetical protein
MTNTAKVGDTIYVARAGSTQVDRPCRICNGDRRVTLILGTGENVLLDCEYCGIGLQAPTGRESFYEFRAAPTPHTVNGIERVATEQGETVKYRSGSNGCYSTFVATDCFPSAEAAAERCAELVAENEVAQERRMHAKEKDNKSYAWHAGYHMREAKRAREQAEHHERKAVLMKEHKRQDSPK